VSFRQDKNLETRGDRKWGSGEVSLQLRGRGNLRVSQEVTGKSEGEELRTKRAVCGVGQRRKDSSIDRREDRILGGVRTFR